MPDSAATRIRRTVSPIPNSKFDQKMGQFHSAAVNGLGQILFWVPGQVLTYTPDQKYSSAKVTQDALHAGPPYLSGGDFFSSSFRCDYDPSAVFGSATRLNRSWNQNLNNGEGMWIQNKKYVGGFVPPPSEEWGFGWEFNLPPSSLLAMTPVTVPDLSGWGDKAWTKSMPKIEQASGFVFAAEMRDIPRMLSTTAHSFAGLWNSVRGNDRPWFMSPKGAADQFLNVQFGWAPFLNDLKTFHKVVDNYSAILESLIERNGKSWRRRVPLFNENTVNVIRSGSGVIPIFNENSNDGSGVTNNWFTSTPSFQVIEEKSTTIYAVGKWKFYSPDFDNFGANILDYTRRWKSIKRFMTVFGLRVSPANVYKAIPWTWLIDWVSNLGDQVDLASSFLMDGVVAEYVYCMQHQITTRTYIQVLPFRDSPVTLKWSQIKETKRRQAAQSPYGFGLSWDDLDPRKLAILAALGISRSG